MARHVTCLGMCRCVVNLRHDDTCRTASLIYRWNNDGQSVVFTQKTDSKEFLACIWSSCIYLLHARTFHSHPYHSPSLLSFRAYSGAEARNCKSFCLEPNFFLHFLKGSNINATGCTVRFKICNVPWNRPYIVMILVTQTVRCRRNAGGMHSVGVVNIRNNFYFKKMCPKRFEKVYFLAFEKAFFTF